MNAKTARAKFDPANDTWFVFVKTTEPDVLWRMRCKELQASLVMQQTDRYRSMPAGDRRDMVHKSLVAAQQGKIKQLIIGSGHLFEQTAPMTTKKYLI
jgi:hypothetical protein